MIAALQPFAIRGAIWYQGESNSGQPGPDQKLLPAMIADWRQVWKNDMPFLVDLFNREDLPAAPFRSDQPKNPVR